MTQFYKIRSSKPEIEIWWISGGKVSKSTKNMFGFTNFHVLIVTQGR